MISLGLDYPFDDESLALGFNNPNLERTRTFEKAYREMCHFMDEDSIRSENDLRLMSESIFDELPDLDSESDSILMGPHADLYTSSPSGIDSETDSILMGPHADLYPSSASRIDSETDSILMGPHADLYPSSPYDIDEEFEGIDSESDSILMGPHADLYPSSASGIDSEADSILMGPHANLFPSSPYDINEEFEGIDSESDSILMGPHADLYPSSPYGIDEEFEGIDSESDSILMGPHADVYPSSASGIDSESESILMGPHADLYTSSPYSLYEESGNRSRRSGTSGRSMDLLNESDSILQFGNLSSPVRYGSVSMIDPRIHMAEDEIPIGWESDSILDGTYADISISEGQPQFGRTPPSSGHRGFTVTEMSPKRSKSKSPKNSAKRRKH